MLDSKLFKCYSPRFLLGVAAAAAGVAALSFATRGFERGSAVRLAVAAIQAVLTAVVIAASVLMIRRLDELEQRIHYEALALAFAGIGAILAGYGFLEKAGLPPVRWTLWAWPLLVVLWSAGIVVVERRYR